VLGAIRWSRPLHGRAVARHQTLDKSRIQIRDCRIPDEQHVLRIAHGMIRKIKASRNDNLVRDDKLIVHEVVRL
jgi:hypothetical protein